MRIEFPHSSREPFLWAQSRLRIGSAPDNDLVLAGDQAGAHHLAILQDHRGLVLEVLPPAGRVYVNARPVRERALLRAGDVLSVGSCRMLLCADETPGERQEPPVVVERQRCTVALRAVAGPLSGRTLPLRERLEMGAGSGRPLALPQGESASLRVFWRDGRLWLEPGAQVSSRYPLRLNGRAVGRSAMLAPGDQIGIAMHRFVVDAPGLQPEPEIVLPEPPPQRRPEAPAGPRGEPWWLIATAAVIALGIALVLLVRF